MPRFAGDLEWYYVKEACRCEPFFGEASSLLSEIAFSEEHPPRNDMLQ